MRQHARVVASYALFLFSTLVFRQPAVSQIANQPAVASSSSVKPTCTYLAPGRDGTMRRTLRVILYPIIPALADYLLQVKTAFENRYCDVKLDLLDLSDNYYSPDSGHFIGDTEADVYELDSIFLRDFADHHKIQPVPSAIQPKVGEYLENAMRAAQITGAWYGVPHWVCGNFLFFRANDTDIAAAKTLKDLEKTIGAHHQPTRGLLIDFKGKSTLGEFYLMSALDRYGTFEAALPHIGTFDSDVETNLRRALALCDAGFCRSRQQHDAAGFNGRQFARRRARALVGYSEILHYVLSESLLSCTDVDQCLTDRELDVRLLPLDDKGAQALSWVDMFTISIKCTGQCLADATAFIQLVTSEAVHVEALGPSLENPRRYLLPARASVYSNPEVVKDTLYTKMKTIIEKSTAPNARGLNKSLRDAGAKVDEALPCGPL